MLAVIKTGGKQYIVKPNEKIKIEKIIGDKDGDVIFDNVLLLSEEDGTNFSVGSPFIKGADVSGKIIEQGRGKKKIVLRYKPKTREKTKKGHKQPYTEVLITKINAPE